jgi:hypothetical protein
MSAFRSLLLAGVACLFAACTTTPSTPADSQSNAPNVAGDWTLTIESQLGSQDSKLSLRQNGTVLTGLFDSPMGSADCTGEIQGENIKFGFDFDAQGMSLRIDFVGTTDGESMKGTAIFGSFGEGTFVGKRM